MHLGVHHKRSPNCAAPAELTVISGGETKRNNGTPQKGSIIMSDKGNELDMLTAQQVHDLTGVPISTLHDWASKRERGIEAPGPHHLRLSDRHRLWARRDVVAWLNAARI